MRKTHVGRMSDASSDEVTVFRDDTLQAEDKAFFLKVRDVVEAAVRGDDKGVIRNRRGLIVIIACAEDHAGAGIVGIHTR